MQTLLVRLKIIQKNIELEDFLLTMIIMKKKEI